MNEPTEFQVQNALEAFEAETRRWRIQGRQGFKWAAFQLSDPSDMDTRADGVGAVHFDTENAARRWVLYRSMQSALTVAMHGRARRPRLDP